MLYVLALDFGERDLTGQRLGCQAMPMFHGMGMMQTGWTVSAIFPPCNRILNDLQAASGLVLTTFKPQSPAMTPMPDAVFHAAINSDTDVIFCVPTFIEVRHRTL